MKCTGGIRPLFTIKNFLIFRSVVGVISEGGQILNSYSYDPFGTILAAMETKPCPFKYHAQRGMVHMAEEMSITAYKLGQRIYATDITQFISKPPVWIPSKYQGTKL